MNEYNGYDAIVYDALEFVYQQGKLTQPPEEAIEQVNNEGDIEILIKQVKNTGMQDSALARRASTQLKNSVQVTEHKVSDTERIGNATKYFLLSRTRDS